MALDIVVNLNTAKVNDLKDALAARLTMSPPVGEPTPVVNDAYVINWVTKMAKAAVNDAVGIYVRQQQTGGIYDVVELTAAQRVQVKDLIASFRA